MEQLQSYEKVPIYRRARDILRDAHQLTAKMNKAYKYSLGGTIRDIALDLTEAVFLAYEERDNLPVKLRHILNIKRLTQRLLASYRIANEVQQVDRDAYSSQVKHIVHIIRQCCGWADKTAVDIDANGGDSSAIMVA